MIGNYLLWWLFGISSCFCAITVACEAIVGGRQVENRNFHSVYRYQVSVQIHGHGHVCGGGVIEVRFILTAAHCVLNENRHLRGKHISILVGMDNLNRTSSPTVTRRVEEVFFPSEFHPTVEIKHGDIAVLKLRAALSLPYEHPFYHRYRMLQLPRNYNMNGHSLRFAGFGWQSYKISTGNGHANGRLQYIDPQILSDLDCEQRYPQGAIDLDKQICVQLETPAMQRLFQGNFSQGLCNGDDGGPLVLDGIAIGILSRIPLDCDFRHEPAIFTRVIHYNSMIFNVIHGKRHSEMISLRTS